MLYNRRASKFYIEVSFWSTLGWSSQKAQNGEDWLEQAKEKTGIHPE